MMKIIKVTLFLSVMLNHVHAQTATGISIIPRPSSITVFKDSFVISNKTTIYTDANSPELEKVAEIFTGRLKQQSNLTVALDNDKTMPRRNSIHLTLKNAPDTLGTEGYILSVQKNGITITAQAPNGIFYGMQSLLQLVPLKTGGSFIKALIPCMVIADKPRFEWRGLMLDVGRYFYSVDFIKKYIDDMAMHKMNTFHWHLTEDHGWRIEIKKYPRLTEIGAWREATQFNKAANQINKTPHGGYYTQDQIREVVAHAKD
ncbi:beta-N-acetylhexosaminidase, partial [Pedobacter heparinus]|uniref:beta-N-acetylhexosaminidase n=1 Tax=Pedobacter heparinus TaxID=984 RepID=UPI00292F1514